MLSLEQVASATRQGLARRGARGNANSKANKLKTTCTHSEHKRPSIPGRFARQTAVNSTHERKSPQPYEPIVTKSMFLLCNQQPRHKDDVCRMPRQIQHKPAAATYAQSAASGWTVVHLPHCGRQTPPLEKACKHALVPAAPCKTTHEQQVHHSHVSLAAKELISIRLGIVTRDRI